MSDQLLLWFHLTHTFSVSSLVAAVLISSPCPSGSWSALCVCVSLQACYGIQKVPKGSWLCRICALGILPKCQLCPKKGGAMKPTRSGTKWVHVSCALWIPEVNIKYTCLQTLLCLCMFLLFIGGFIATGSSVTEHFSPTCCWSKTLCLHVFAFLNKSAPPELAFESHYCALQVSIGNPEKMEPITNVSHIPSNRWALICCLCKEKAGACIQVRVTAHISPVQHKDVNETWKATRGDCSRRYRQYDGEWCFLFTSKQIWEIKM